MKISPDTLFLSGIILMCFGFLVFHINPIFAEYNQNIWHRLSLFVHQLFVKPVGTLGIFSGLVLVFMSLKNKS